MRRLWTVLGWAAFVAVVAAWIVFLRPQYLGGPAGYVTVNGKSMEPRMHTGDVVLVHRRDAYRAGDVVAYRIPTGEAKGRVVIHRIVGGSDAEGYVMRGDNRDSNDVWRPKPSDVLGAEELRMPGARASSPAGSSARSASGCSPRSRRSSSSRSRRSASRRSPQPTRAAGIPPTPTIPGPA